YISAIKQAKFALGLIKHGKVRPVPVPHVAKDVGEARALYNLVKEQGRDGALGIVQGEHALGRIEFTEEAGARENAPEIQPGVEPYSGNVEVRHLLWEIAEGEGYELLKQAAHKGLKGLKVAPFYGCQILRPSKILGFEDPDRPWSLERIIEACGGEAIDYPAK